MSTDFKVPSTHHWSLGMQRQLPWDFALDVSYVGRKPIPAQDKIALINGTHYLLGLNGPGNMSTDKNKIFVPLDFSIEPKILPEFLSEAAKHEKYIY